MPGAGPSTAVRPPRLVLHGIRKGFAGRLANDGIDLRLAAGEIHALLGENGAGKSTLVKIIHGSLRADAGTMEWEGRPVTVASPADAGRLGIAMVFQHFSLFDSLSIADNIRLGLDHGGPRAAFAARIEEVSRRYGLPLEPERTVHTLSAGERQRVEIIRCLMRAPRLLILDEPTSVLSPGEVGPLFETLRRLAAEGCSVLFISHKLAEIRALCQQVTVLREGRVVGGCDPRTTGTAELARLMIGAAPPVPDPADRPAPGPVRLRLRDLSLEPGHPRAVALHRLELEVRGGEIVGIAGVAGNGQAELLAALSGEAPGATPGMIGLDGEPVAHLGPRPRRELGLAAVPEERLGRSAVPAMTLADNALLTGFGVRGLVRHGLIRFERVREFAADIVAAFRVAAPGPQAEAGSLSGGNLQKFVVGREILQYPGVLVAAAPTWGVDAGAAALIHQALRDLARSGSAVLVISPDLDELFLLADRIAVLSHGRLTEPVPVAEADIGRIGQAMGGVLEPEEGAAPMLPPPALSPPVPPPLSPAAQSSVPRRKAGPPGRRLRLEPRAAKSPLWSWLSPLLAVALTVLTGAALFAALGLPAAAALRAYFIEPVSSLAGLTELGVKATPLVLCAVGLALGFRANVWNIGAEGQLTVGALCAAAVALAGWGEEGWWTLPLMALAAMAGGMAWAALPAWLRVRWNASEILTSLMLSYVAGLLLVWAVHGPLRDPDGFGFPESRLFGARALVPVLVAGTRLHLGAVLALAAALAGWLVLSRSLAGFRLKVQGLAPAAAHYAGFGGAGAVWTGFLAGGALSGLAGMLEVAGPIGQLTPSISPGYGFTAIIAAFLGRLHPLGIVAAALMLALSFLGGEAARIGLGLPQAITQVFQGLLLFYLLAADLLVRWRLRWGPP